MVKSQRLISLDVFRGMTVAGMILVNTPGSWGYVYSPLRHAPWHGLTPTDLVFPFFLFAVGAAASFSLGKFSTSKSAYLKIAKRTFLIFLIGFLMNGFPFFSTQPFQWIDIEKWRIFGVLQRIALAYGLGAALCYALKDRQLYIASGLILLSYWFILVFFGGAKPYSLEGNAVGILDRMLFGEGHLYKGFGIPFDPEGLLSTLPSAVSVILGYLAGKFVQIKKDRKEIMIRFFVAGNSLLLAGLFWALVFPVNKPIWTSSYVLVTTGIALNLLSMLIYLVDVKNYKSGVEPFLVFGRNPLIIFLLSIAIVKIYFRIHIGDLNFYSWLYQFAFQSWAGNMFGSFLFAVFHVVLLWLFGLLLYRKNILIKI